MGESFHRRLTHKGKGDIKLMLNIIRQQLEQNAKVSAWSIKEDRSRSKELFFIKNKLDMNRAVEVLEFHVCVYVDFEEGETRYKGDANVLISASDTEEEIAAKIDKAVFAAGFVKNKWYDLPEDDGDSYPELPRYDNVSDLKARYDDLYDVLFKSYPYRSKVNSCEVFATTAEQRVVTSKGCDVTYPHNHWMFELVTDDSEGEEPVEIFNDYDLTRMDLEQIESIVDRQLMETEGRSLAVRNEKIDKIRIILTGDAVESLLEFYVSQATDWMIYSNISRVRKGEYFVSESARQKLNVTMNPELTFSIYSKPVDEEGRRLKPFVLFKDGVAENIRSSARYSHYLDIPHTGMVQPFEVEAGVCPIDDYSTGDYLELIAFSSFNMDPTTGDFGGEFRLAKLVRNSQMSWVTGGAISENIFDVQDRMVFSARQIRRKNSLTPEAIIIDGVTVSGT